MSQNPQSNSAWLLRTYRRIVRHHTEMNHDCGDGLVKALESLVDVWEK